MLLSELLQIPIPTNFEKNILSLAIDSRKVTPGTLFFAYPGTQQDGRNFIDDALAKGADAIVAEGPEFTITSIANKPIVHLQQLSHKVAEYAARFYNYPTQKLHTIGITGTNGKTSCSHFIGRSLTELNMPCGIIGTLGNGLYPNISEGTLTTPDAITLQKTFAEFVAQKAKAVAMEVSSHSLDQGRVNAIDFEIGIFTNLTRDHLDYHKTMEDYGRAKQKLFEFSSLRYAILNSDDEFGEKLSKSIPSSIDLITYSTQAKHSQHPNVHAEKINFTSKGFVALVNTPWGKGEIFAPLIGSFNLSNVLAVVATLGCLGISFSDIQNVISKLQPVPGRMQLLGGEDKPLVVVDYAHTPDALEKVLMALRAHYRGKLVCIFGCGGNRDKGKRPLMAKIAEKYADRVIVSDDNPRFEDPKQIAAEICEGFSKIKDVLVEHDRARAICLAIKQAGIDDCIVVAGKGVETVQIIGEEKIPFNDVKQVQACLIQY